MHITWYVLLYANLCTQPHLGIHVPLGVSKTGISHNPILHECLRKHKGCWFICPFLGWYRTDGKRRLVGPQDLQIKIRCFLHIHLRCRNGICVGNPVLLHRRTFARQPYSAGMIITFSPPKERGRLSQIYHAKMLSWPVFAGLHQCSLLSPARTK